MAYTDREVAWAGLTENNSAGARPQRRQAGFPRQLEAVPSPMDVMRGSPSFCSTKPNHRVLGGGIVGTHAGDLIGEARLAAQAEAISRISVRQFIRIRHCLNRSAWRRKCSRGRLHGSPAAQKASARPAHETRVVMGGDDGRAIAARRAANHWIPTFGKISVTPTKSSMNQRDLALAYSPGVAYACLAIKDDQNEAATLTSRANLVAVITNGSAVLGLGTWSARWQARDGRQSMLIQQIRRDRRV